MLPTPTNYLEDPRLPRQREDPRLNRQREDRRLPRQLEDPRLNRQLEDPRLNRQPGVHKPSLLGSKPALLQSPQNETRKSSSHTTSSPLPASHRMTNSLPPPTSKSVNHQNGPLINSKEILEELRKLRKNYLKQSPDGQPGTSSSIPGLTLVNKSEAVWDKTAGAGTAGSLPLPLPKRCHTDETLPLRATKTKSSDGNMLPPPTRTLPPASRSAPSTQVSSQHIIDSSETGVVPERNSTDKLKTPLTGAATLHQPPEGGSILNLPISPRELAYAELVKESQRRAALPIRRSVMVERSRLPPQRYPPKDYLEHPGLLEPENGYYGWDRRQRHSFDDLPHEDGIGRPFPPHENRRYPPTRDRDLSPPPSKAKKKTWPKPETEKASITEDLLPYVGMESCDICNVQYTHPIHAKSHLVGKNHHKKLKVLGLPVPDYCIDKSKPQKAPVPAKSADDEVPAAEAEEEEWPEWLTQKFFDDFCEVCNVPLSSIMTADAHYVGKKHLKKCNAALAKHKKGDSQAGAHLFCSTCNIHCSSPEVMQQHYKGQKHQMAEKWHRTITDKPNVSEVRVTEISVDIQSKEELDSQSKQREAESAANDFFSMAAKMNGM